MQLFCADASGKIPYGCFFDGGWSFGEWNKSFLEWAKPSIKVLELYTLCIGIIAWGHLLQNTRVIIFCDNQVIVEMVNNTTSGYKNCMHFLWLLVLNGLQFNRSVSMKYVKSSKNILAVSQGSSFPHSGEKYLKILNWNCTQYQVSCDPLKNSGNGNNDFPVLLNLADVKKWNILSTYSMVSTISTIDCKQIGNEEVQKLNKTKLPLNLEIF